MRGDDHHEAAVAVDVVKGLAPPDGRAGPYLTMRAFIVGGSNNGSTTSRGERAWGLGRWSRAGTRVRDRPFGRPAGGSTARRGFTGGGRESTITRASIEPRPRGRPRPSHRTRRLLDGFLSTA